MQNMAPAVITSCDGSIYRFVQVGLLMQVALFSVWFIEFLAFIGLVIGIVLKETKASGSIEWTCASSSVRCQQFPVQSDWCVLPVQSQQWFFQQHVQEISNVTIGAILWLVLAVGQLSFVHRLLAATRSGKRWCVAVMNALTCVLLPDPAAAELARLPFHLRADLLGGLQELAALAGR